MKNLKAYVEQKNRFAKIFGQAQWDIAKLDQAMADEIYQAIDSNLSPECLHADGERPIAQVRKLYKQYMGAITELKKAGYNPTVKTYEF